MLEVQLQQMETRMLRREKELLAAVEEGRVAAKIEQSRLESMHRLELREKEEELLQFRTELENLVGQLRNQVGISSILI